MAIAATQQPPAAAGTAPGGPQPPSLRQDPTNAAIMGQPNIFASLFGGPGGEQQELATAQKDMVKALGLPENTPFNSRQVTQALAQRLQQAGVDPRTVMQTDAKGRPTGQLDLVKARTALVNQLAGPSNPDNPMDTRRMSLENSSFASLLGQLPQPAQAAQQDRMQGPRAHAPRTVDNQRPMLRPPTA